MTADWNSLLADTSQHPFDSNTSLPDLFLCPLPELGLINLVGEQSQSYLQGQLTCDLNNLTKSAFSLAAHCDAKGKMWSILRVFQYADGFMLSAHSHELAASLAQLKKYGVFAKTTIDDVSADWFSFGLGGPNAQQWLKDHYNVEFTEQNNAADIQGGKILKLNEQQFQIFLADGSSLVSALSTVIYASQYWDLLCVKAGLPYLSEPAINQYVPQMLNLHCLNAISFTKGCYSGQEMVARMKYLGKNKRATFLLTGHASQLPQDGHELQLAIGENWRRSGLAINVAGSSDNLFVLAVLPNDTPIDANLRLKDDQHSALTISPLPYSLEANDLS